VPAPRFINLPQYSVLSVEEDEHDYHVYVTNIETRTIIDMLPDRARFPSLNGSSPFTRKATFGT
jgi:hypothetical protein